MIPMTQDIQRRWNDEPEAKSITNYPDPERIPSSLKDRLAMELVVECVCPKCTHESFYYSNDSTQTVECDADDCDEEFLLP